MGLKEQESYLLARYLIEADNNGIDHDSDIKDKNKDKKIRDIHNSP